MEFKIHFPISFPDMFRHVLVDANFHFHWLGILRTALNKQDSDEGPENDPQYSHHQGDDDYGDVEQQLPLYDDASSQLYVDKPTEDDGGVEDEGEGPECYPEWDVVVTVLPQELGDHGVQGADTALYWPLLIQYNTRTDQKTQSYNVILSRFNILVIKWHEVCDSLILQNSL